MICSLAKHNKLFITGKYNRAFTLVEVIVSLSILSILTLSVGASFTIVLNAIPSNKPENQHILDSYWASQNIQDEIHAIAFVKKADDTNLQYVTSSQHNGVLSNIKLATTDNYLTYSNLSASPSTNTTDIAASKIELITENTTTKYLHTNTSSTLTQSNHTITSDIPFSISNSQYIAALWPSKFDNDTYEYTIHGFWFKVRKTMSSFGALQVQIVTVDQNLQPLSNILREDSIAISSISFSPNWLHYTLDEPLTISANQRIAIIFKTNISSPIVRMACSSNTNGSLIKNSFGWFDHTDTVDLLVEAKVTTLDATNQSQNTIKSIEFSPANSNLTATSYATNNSPEIVNNCDYIDFTENETPQSIANSNWQYELENSSPTNQGYSGSGYVRYTDKINIKDNQKSIFTTTLHNMDHPQASISIINKVSKNNAYSVTKLLLQNNINTGNTHIQVLQPIDHTNWKLVSDIEFPQSPTLTIKMNSSKVVTNIQLNRLKLSSIVNQYTTYSSSNDAVNLKINQYATIDSASLAYQETINAE